MPTAVRGSVAIVAVLEFHSWSVVRSSPFLLAPEKHRRTPAAPLSVPGWHLQLCSPVLDDVSLVAMVNHQRKNIVWWWTAKHEKHEHTAYL